MTVGDRDVLLPLCTVEIAGETGGERGDIGDRGEVDDELGEVGIAELGCEDTSAMVISKRILIQERKGGIKGVRSKRLVEPWRI